ncbi:hypothetical protein OCL06_16040 [Alteromonas sp. ASW11-19]|uniref:HNH endonuclease n=1 Tax=Alteromonas salexigens TaxID=2982530 RepID=A0ABT2VT59_9ALTE|nr:hypothetical protein [Alteromonas salexigens]MCU7556103.1 hypothetical protein [Alteromonas salexigens]
MSHRTINNVGYKKIYPMSEGKDDTFCHYCGREARVGLGLQWDHVPALNCAIPEEHKHICRTLVRACSECNLMASDTPHLDYLERHYWLKSKYLERYKKLLLDDAAIENIRNAGDSFLDGYLNNQSFLYFELLKAIGFGVVHISQIDSPVLSLKCRSGRTIEEVLIDYLFGAPNVIKDEENDDEDGSVNIIYADYIAYLSDTIKEEAVITEDRVKEISRANTVNIPENPTRYYGVSWATIARDVMAKTNNPNLLRSKGEESIRKKPAEVQEILISDEIEISINRFTSVMVEILLTQGKRIQFDEEVYASILKKQKKMGGKVPLNPTKYFGTDWETLNDYIQGKFNQRMLADRNKAYVERVIKGEVGSANNMDSYHSGQALESEKTFSSKMKGEKTPRDVPINRRKNNDSVEDVLNHFNALREQYYKN